jgi:uncharacterized membrane protein
MWTLKKKNNKKKKKKKRKRVYHETKSYILFRIIWAIGISSIQYLKVSYLSFKYIRNTCFIYLLMLLKKYVN